MVQIDILNPTNMKLPKINFKTRFWKSCGEVLLLLAFTFIPLALNIALATIPATNKIDAITSKVVPGEMLAYCLSFIAPLFILLIKTNGHNYRLPFLSVIMVVSISLYCFTLCLTLIAKNQLVEGIDFKPGHRDLYFWLSIIFLFSTILLRIYTAYHNAGYSDFQQTRNKQQTDFNKVFRKSIS